MLLLYLLRLFVPFQKLEIELGDMRLALDEAVKERDAALAERDKFMLLLEQKHEDAEYLRRLTDETLVSERAAYANERATYQMCINHSVQRLGGTAPYPEANTLPEASVPKHQEPGPIGRAGRMLPSQMVARDTQNYIRAVVAAKGNG